MHENWEGIDCIRKCYIYTERITCESRQNVEDKYQVAHHHPVHSGDSGRPRHIARSSIACLTNTTMDGIALLKATQDDRHFERDTWLDSRGDGMFSVNDGGTTRLAVGESQRSSGIGTGVSCEQRTSNRNGETPMSSVGGRSGVRLKLRQSQQTLLPPRSRASTYRRRQRQRQRQHFKGKPVSSSK